MQSSAQVTNKKEIILLIEIFKNLLEIEHHRTKKTLDSRNIVFHCQTLILFSKVTKLNNDFMKIANNFIFGFKIINKNTGV